MTPVAAPWVLATAAVAFVLAALFTGYASPLMTMALTDLAYCF